MDLDQIFRLMQNAGFRIYGTDAEYIYIEDPSCILRSFATFAEYAWIVLIVVTGLLLFGWAISMIRGAKNDIFTNLRNLILIFGIVSAAGPIITGIYGDDLFARGCKTVQVSIPEIQKLLDARNAKLSGRDTNNLYEELHISDTGPQIIYIMDPDTPYDTDDNSAITPETSTPSGPEMPSTPPNTSDRPIQATESGKDVIYIYTNQSKKRRHNGTRAWRNNNPGNIRPGRFSDRIGGIGRAGGFAVFPDEQTGLDAIVRLLKTDSYQKKTLAGAIRSWAPPSDGNNTSAYQRQVEKAIGVSINTPMRNLTDSQLYQLATIIRKIEGWNPGTEIKQ